jgi:LysR family hydrogen peroxide-inducible transcriptional activator
MTVLPKLACHGLPDAQLRNFAGKKPTREISLVSARSFLKEKHLDALEKCILENLPNEVFSNKKSNLNVLNPL